VRVFRQDFALEDAISSHACSFQVTNGIPLECTLFLPVHTVNCVQTLKGNFTKLKTLQSGEGRTVHLVRHVGSGLVIVQKVIHREGQAEVLEAIMTEIDLMHKFNSPYIVNFYGAYVTKQTQEVNILMENMNVGCLCNVIKHVGRIHREEIMGKVATSTITGLEYVWDKHKVLHRDIKPSNILVNTSGSIKICDFGVSKSLGSMDLAMTFVGTMMYLSPERIQGNSYDSLADQWSLGLTLVELATGSKPIPVTDEPKVLVPVRSPNDPKPVQKREQQMAPFTLIQGLLGRSNVFCSVLPGFALCGIDPSTGFSPRGMVECVCILPAAAISC
jgi:serine/threonine protein kinase